MMSSAPAQSSEDLVGLSQGQQGKTVGELSAMVQQSGGGGGGGGGVTATGTTSTGQGQNMSALESLQLLQVNINESWRAFVCINRIKAEVNIIQLISVEFVSLWLACWQKVPYKTRYSSLCLSPNSLPGPLF